MLSCSLVALLSLGAEYALAQTAEDSVFRFDRINALVLIVLFSAAVLLFTKWARGGKKLFLRKIPGLDAVEEAVGRATEMGKPVLFIPGLQELDDIETIAGISILGKLSKIDDGLLDAFMLNMRELSSYAGLIDRMVNLDTDDARDYMRQGKEMTIETDPDLPVWMDGEYSGRTPIQLKVLPAALPVVVPE